MEKIENYFTSTNVMISTTFLGDHQDNQPSHSERLFLVIFLIINVYPSSPLGPL